MHATEHALNQPLNQTSHHTLHHAVGQALSEFPSELLQATAPDGRAGNAWRHGLDARRVLVPTEQQPDFDALRAALVAEWRPANVTAWLLVDHLARLHWRLLRAGEAEVERLGRLQRGNCNGIGNEPASVELALAVDVGRADSTMARMQVYQMRLERAVHRSIGLLISLRKSRGKRGGLPRPAAPVKSPQPVAGAGDDGQARNYALDKTPR